MPMDAFTVLCAAGADLAARDDAGRGVADLAPTGCVASALQAIKASRASRAHLRTAAGAAS